MAWERLGIPQNELENVAGEREVWVRLLTLDKRVTMDGCLVLNYSQCLSANFLS